MAETTRWEYRVETFGGILSQVKDDFMEETLDEWGEEGWEVIAAHNLENTYKVRIIARRPLSSTIRRRRTWPAE